MTIYSRVVAVCSLSALFLTVGGCGKSRRPTTVGSSPSQPAPSRILDASEAGLLRLGMPKSEVASLPNLTVVSDTLTLEGQKTPVLRISRFGLPYAVAELENGKVSRLRVFTDQLRTKEGAYVGITASELEKLYGPGQLLTGEGNVCARFETEPGVSFCFRPQKGSRLPVSDWKQLAQRNPTVAMILITGK